jgi:hypothetical protein
MTRVGAASTTAGDGPFDTSSDGMAFSQVALVGLDPWMRRHRLSAPVAA